MVIYKLNKILKSTIDTAYLGKKMYRQIRQSMLEVKLTSWNFSILKIVSFSTDRLVL